MYTIYLFFVCVIILVFSINFYTEKLIGICVYGLTNESHFFSIVEDGYSLIPSWRRDRPDEARQPHLYVIQTSE